MYRLAHYVKLKPLCKSIAVLLACKVVIPLNQNTYLSIKDKLGVKRDIDTEIMKEYHERYPFINWFYMICHEFLY